MANWNDLLTECQRLEDVAREIQNGEQIGLSDREIKALASDYHEWFGKCLSILPDDLKNKFRAEYEGSFWNAKIKKFFESATEPSPFRSTDEATQIIFPYWAYPFKQNCLPPLQSQRQLLIEARERNRATTSSEE